MLSYLDPGTGSMIAAAFAGGAAGFGVLMRMYGHRLLGVFSKKHRMRAAAAASLVVTAPPSAVAIAFTGWVEKHAAAECGVAPTSGTPSE